MSQNISPIHAASDDWTKQSARFKYGGVIRRMVSVGLMNVERGVLDRISKSKKNVVKAAKHLASGPSPRTKGVLDGSMPVFTEDRDYLRELLARHLEGDETVAKKAETEGGNA